MTTARTLVRGAWVLTMAPFAELVRDGAVAIDDHGAIIAVASHERLAERWPTARVIGDGDGIVMPGLINAHTHLTESLLPGMGEDCVRWEWLNRVLAPCALVTTREDVLVGTRLRAAEMLLSGITTVNDMSCHRNLGAQVSLGAVDGLAEMGLRGVVAFGAEDAYPGAPKAVAFVAEHEALADRCTEERLIGFRAGIASVLGISDDLFAATVAACRANDWSVHTHLAEVREELTAARTRWDMSTIQHADRTGLLEHRVIAGHCVWCAETDIGLLASRDVAVAHTPVSDMILASGVCPVGRLRREGVAVGLGTDGAAASDNQDMFGVLKTAALLQKVDALDPHALSAPEALRMATIEGARALGLDRDIGSLEPGKRADIVLLDGNTPEMATIHDPFQQVVYGATARCVSDVWVYGVRRVADGRVVDADVTALVRDARRQAADLVTRAGQGAESVLAGRGRVTWE